VQSERGKNRRQHFHPLDLGKWHREITGHGVKLKMVLKDFVILGEVFAVHLEMQSASFNAGRQS